MSCIERLPDVVIGYQRVLYTRPQIKVSLKMEVYLLVINSSHCLIYNVLMHKLIKFGSKIKSTPNPKI